MRTLLLCFWSFFSVTVGAQVPRGMPVDDIASLEMKGKGSRLAALEPDQKSLASDDVDIRYYRAEWTVDPAVRRIDGKVTVYYLMKSAGNSIALDLSQSLQVNQVTQRSNVLTVQHSSDHLVINIPFTAVGVLDSLTIDYGGIPSNSGVGSFVVTTHGSTPVPVMWTLSEPFGSKDWWPCKNGLNDKAEDGIDIILIHPAGFNGEIYKAAANGMLIGETALPNGKVRTHWKHGYPIASYLVCFAITNYALTTRSVLIDGVNLPVINYAYPESKAIFDAGTQNALDAMQFFSTEFEPYPFLNEKYGHVQFSWGGGMEHQTSSFMVNMDENLVAHELAHHWFGDKITCNAWEDIWLNEGFATYLANIYRENKYPSSKNSIRSTGINYITSTPNGSVRVDDTADVNRIFSGRLSYYKGAHLLYMLRWIMGDTPFRQAIRNYLSDPNLIYNFAQTSDLKRHLEAVAGKDLTYFFDQWYTGQGFPSYQLSWKKSGTGVQFNLKQTTSDASIGFFKLPVPILFRNNTTNQQQLLVADHTFNDQDFTETLGFIPETAQIDPEYWLITRNNTVTELTDPLPVRFSRVDLQCLGDIVTLSWQTSMELAANFFEIEKSVDAVHWTQVGRVDAVGNAQQASPYSFTDSHSTFGMVYYRIIAQDLDGSRQPTRTLSQVCGQLDRVAVMPNPVTQRLRFKNLPVFQDQAKLHIWDQQGRPIQVLSVSYYDLVTTGIDLSTLPEGLYVVRVEVADKDFHLALPFLKK